MAITRYTIYALTVMFRDDILNKDIPYVRYIIDKEFKDKKDKEKWNIFWYKYFIKFWIFSDNFISCWNINDGDDSHSKLQNRTNTGLERYNCTLNDNFPSPRPSILNFVLVIEEEARLHVKRLKIPGTVRWHPSNLQVQHCLNINYAT